MRVLSIGNKVKHSPEQGTNCSQVISRIAQGSPFKRYGCACCITTPSTRLSKFIQSTLERCKTVAQTQTSLLVTASSPLWRVATNLHPQQVTVELLVERRGTTYLPEQQKLSKSQIRVDNERQGGLPHNQGHECQSRTDLRGPGKLRGKGEPTALNISL